jgi:hypothetical protein
MRRTASAVVLAGLAAGLTLSACSSTSASSSTGLRATAAASPRGSAALASTPTAVAISPAAVRAAADTYYALYAAGEYAQTWPLLTATVRHEIPESTWIAVHDSCPGKDSKAGYRIGQITMGHNVAAVTVTIAAKVTIAAFSYSASRWYYLPSGVTDYEHGSVSADVAALKAAGSDCS